MPHQDHLLLKLFRRLLPIPRFIWKRQVTKSAAHSRRQLAFMTEDHHHVRDFAVIELPRRARPLAPADIAVALSMEVEQVVSILDDLEAHKTFICRDDAGAVE